MSWQWTLRRQTRMPWNSLMLRRATMQKCPSTTTTAAPHGMATTLGRTRPPLNVVFPVWELFQLAHCHIMSHKSSRCIFWQIRLATSSLIFFVLGEEKGGNLAELSLSLTAAVQEWLEKRFAKFGGETWSSRPLSIYEASRKFSAFQWFQKSTSGFV